MYGAKRAGRDGFEVFDGTAHQTFAWRSGLAVELAAAIERSELFVLYQPLFRLDDGSLSGARSMLRCATCNVATLTWRAMSAKGDHLSEMP